MSMFTLACLTTSNLPWFMPLTFQAPRQYCSLQHRTLLPSPVTSTTGCCFCFGSISSFFLELFLHWSPVAYWAPTNLGVHLSVSYLLPFHTVHGVLKAKISSEYSLEGLIETPILWPPDAKSWLIWKDPDAGKDWRREETGMTEDKMVGWHHHLDGHEFEWTLGVGDEQGSLEFCSPWGCKESDMTELLNWTELVLVRGVISKSLIQFSVDGWSYAPSWLFT